jgi:hypothetical protein
MPFSRRDRGRRFLVQTDHSRTGDRHGLSKDSSSSCNRSARVGRHYFNQRGSGLSTLHDFLGTNSADGCEMLR